MNRSYISASLLRALPILLILGNIGLKLSFVEARALISDEAFSVYHAQMDVGDIIYHLSTGNNPPLYEILLHFWIKFFGISPLSVRFPSVLCSVFTVYFVYRIGKDFFSEHVGLVTALLFTFSDYHLYFSQETRVYAFLMLLTSISMHRFLHICRQPQQQNNYIILLIANILMLYAHYFSFFVVFVQFISVLFIFNKILLRNYILYTLLLFVLYIPNISIFVHRFFSSARQGTWVAPPDGVVDLYNMLWRFCNQPVTTVYTIVVVFLSFAKWGLGFGGRSASTASKIIVFWFAFPFFFMFAVSYKIPMFTDRYLGFVSLAYYLIISISINYLFEHKIYKTIFYTPLLALFVFTLNPKNRPTVDIREPLALVQKLRDKKTKIIFSPKYMVLNVAYYLDKDIFMQVDKEQVYDLLAAAFKQQGVYAVDHTNEVDTQELLQAEKVIFIDIVTPYHVNNMVDTLLQHLHHRETHSFFNNAFTVYVLSKTASEPVAPTE